MEWIGFALLGVTLLGGAVFLGRWMTRRGRNQGDHGGGMDDYKRICDSGGVLPGSENNTWI